MKWTSALLATVFYACLPVCGFPQSGEMALASTAQEAGAEQPSPGAQQRARERRRQREQSREWISVPEMDRETLRGLLQDPDVTILDVTCKERGEKIPEQIPGTVWRDCTQVEQWAPQYKKDQTIVVYCA